MPSPDDILNLSSGAQWLKADLHVHTPASSDMDEKWKNATAVDLVRIAIDKELDVIAITDHNTAVWCDDVRTAANGTRLTVFPGVEISTHQGHILAIFDSTVAADRIEDLLVTVGISRSRFGSLDVATTQGMTEVSAAIADAGAVAIAAHVDGKRGFLRMINSGAERQRVYADQNLWAIEILDTSLRDEYQTGKKAGYERRIACVQSSDSWVAGAAHHQLDGISTRYSLLKMDDKSISGLKLSLIDPEIRVRLAGDDPLAPDSVILGMWVTGGFLGAQRLRFNENVSCLIGDTGSGKSVAIELLRFGLGQQTYIEKIRREIESLLAEQLGANGAVHIVVEKGGVRYLIERTWATSADRPLVQRITGAGLIQVDQLDMKLFFPAKCFSQSEIIEFAREPQARLSLTDDLIDCSTENSAIMSIKTSLKENAGAIVSVEEIRDDIGRQLEARPNLVEDLVTIDQILDHPMIIQQEDWYKEQAMLKEAAGEIDEFEDELVNEMPSLELKGTWLRAIGDLPNHDLLGAVKDVFGEVNTAVAQAQSGLSADLKDAVRKTDALRARWDKRFEVAETEYRRLLNEIDSGRIGLQALSQRRRGVRQQIEGLDRKQEQLDSEVTPRVDTLKAAREKLLDSLQDYRRKITRKREEKASELTRALNNRVRLKVHGRANIALFREKIGHLAQRSYLQAQDLDEMAANSHPLPFAKHLLNASYGDLSGQIGCDTQKIERLHATIVDRHRLQSLYDLQMIDVDDIIDIDLRLSSGGYRPLEKLSHGQKCMVVLMIALAEGDFPLLVDQPEDALHAPSIEHGIVSILRSDRGVRQCVFATRNANILVSADAEQIIALRADADHGEVVGTGSLDRFDHRELVIYHVEGGRDAFERRKTMYTLSPP